MIHAHQLTKDYGPNRAVDGLSFDVAQGEVVGFLGPNGAGKSTTIRMVTGFSPPTSGTATINGLDVLRQSHKARRNIGYLPESTPLYPEMRVTEYLDHRGRLMDMPRALRRKRIDAVIEQCNLVPMRRRTIGRLSKGNRQRVGLAQALLHEPPVLVLDEPTSGFDPNQIQQFRKLLAELKGKHTILLSTHILPEIDQTADRMLILAHGKLVANGTADELRQQLAQRLDLGHIALETQAPAEQAIAAFNQTLTNAAIPKPIPLNGGWQQFAIQASQPDACERLANTCQQNAWPIRLLHRPRPSLDQLFAQMTTAPGSGSPGAAGKSAGQARADSSASA